jgi:hypothetical protein
MCSHGSVLATVGQFANCPTVKTARLTITGHNFGGVMLQKSGSSAVVKLQLQTTPDLSASFTDHGEPVAIEVELPGDQHFLRIRALGPQ